MPLFRSPRTFLGIVLMLGDAIRHVDIRSSRVGSVSDDHNIQLRVDPALQNGAVAFWSLLFSLVQPIPWSGVDCRSDVTTASNPPSVVRSTTQSE